MSLVAKKQIYQDAVPKVLVIDDDPSFGKILSHVAQKYELELTICSSIEELSKVPYWQFDIVVMDYDLGYYTGVELSDYFSEYIEFGKQLPVVLISHSEQIKSEEWTDNIVEFVRKDEGAAHILEMVFEIYTNINQDSKQA